MLAIQDIENLIKNTLKNEIISGTYLPINNNPSFLDFDKVTAVVILKNDENKKSFPVAFGLTQKITNNQYYVMINAIDEEYSNKNVSVTHNQTSYKSLNYQNLSILSINNANIFPHFLNNNKNAVIVSPISTSFLPYHTVFSDKQTKPLLEILFEETIRNLNIQNNFYVTYNMTVDIIYEGKTMERESENILRNYAGFNVIDKMYIYKCSHSLESLKASLENDFDYNIDVRCLEIDKNNLEMIIEYDEKVIGIKRKDYLEHLFKLGNVRGLLQINDENNIIGYILSMNNHILGCYGDNQHIQINLIKNILSKLDNALEVTFFLNCQENLLTTKILENALELREVRRLHTLSIITKLNWEKIRILGIGCHIF